MEFDVCRNGARAFGSRRVDSFCAASWPGVEVRGVGGYGGACRRFGIGYFPVVFRRGFGSVFRRHARQLFELWGVRIGVRSAHRLDVLFIGLKSLKQKGGISFGAFDLHSWIDPIRALEQLDVFIRGPGVRYGLPLCNGGLE